MSCISIYIRLLTRCFSRDKALDFKPEKFIPNSLSNPAQVTVFCVSESPSVQWEQHRLPRPRPGTTAETHRW